MRSIKIGGFLVQVEYDDNVLLDRENLGEFHPRSQKIILQSNMTAQQEKETLIHEIIEAINYIYGLEFEHSKLSLLATVLHQIFTDNANLVLNADAR